MNFYSKGRTPLCERYDCDCEDYNFDDAQRNDGDSACPVHDEGDSDGDEPNGEIWNPHHHPEYFDPYEVDEYGADEDEFYERTHDLSIDYELESEE